MTAASTSSPLGNKTPASIDDDEIFKSLGHKVRREIIKFVGTEKRASFSSIQKAVGNIDSPALSYHLKTLQPLFDQQEDSYALSEVGLAAFKLLILTGDAERVKIGKRKFSYAYIVTVACWIAAESIIPFFISPGDGNVNYIIYQIIINSIAITNFITIWRLRQGF